MRACVRVYCMRTYARVCARWRATERTFCVTKRDLSCNENAVKVKFVKQRYLSKTFKMADI